MLKKNIANIPDIARNIAALAVSSDRTRKIESRTSGTTARCSIKTNAPRSTAERPKKPSVVADVQPSVADLTIA